MTNRTVSLEGFGIGARPAPSTVLAKTFFLDKTTGSLYRCRDDGGSWDAVTGGSGASFAYVHDQQVPQSTWTVVHNLNGFPNVTVIDSASREVEGDVTYDSVNQLTLTFSAPFGGKAYLS